MASTILGSWTTPLQLNCHINSRTGGQKRSHPNDDQSHPQRCYKVVLIKKERVHWYCFEGNEND